MLHIEKDNNNESSARSGSRNNNGGDYTPGYQKNKFQSQMAVDDKKNLSSNI